MAPYVGPTRAALVKRLRAKRPELPVTLGSGSPQAVVAHEGGEWTLRPLVTNEKALEQGCKQAMAEQGMYVPEMSWQALDPGPPIIRAKALDEFIAALEKMPWRYGPEK